MSTARESGTAPPGPGTVPRRFRYRFGLVAVLGVTVMALAIVLPQFRTVANLTNVVNQAAIVAVAGTGMTVAIASGVFDLSIGSILALSAAVGAILVNLGSVSAAVAGALATGAVLGTVNGLITTKLRVPAFIATLAMMVVLRGVVLVLTGGRDITVTPDMIDRFGVLGGGRLGPVPVPILIMLLVYALFAVLLHHTPFGRHAYGVGSNADAAASSGLRVDRILIVVFALVGATAALSGLIQTAQIKGVSGATAGVTFELQVIAVVVLGGTSLKGGRARLFGTMLGAVLVAVANNALNLCNTPSFYQHLAMGLILLAAVGLDGRRRRGEQHRMGMEL